MDAEFQYFKTALWLLTPFDWFYEYVNLSFHIIDSYRWRNTGEVFGIPTHVPDFISFTRYCYHSFFL